VRSQAVDEPGDPGVLVISDIRASLKRERPLLQAAKDASAEGLWKSPA